MNFRNGSKRQLTPHPYPSEWTRSPSLQIHTIPKYNAKDVSVVRAERTDVEHQVAWLFFSVRGGNFNKIIWSFMRFSSIPYNTITYHTYCHLRSSRCADSPPDEPTVLNHADWKKLLIQFVLLSNKSNSILRHRSTTYWLRSKQVWVWTPVSCESNHNWFQMLSSLQILARANDGEKFKQRLFIEHSIKLKLLCIFGNDLIFTRC